MEVLTFRIFLNKFLIRITPDNEAKSKKQKAKTGTFIPLDRSNVGDCNLQLNNDILLYQLVYETKTQTYTN
jgi:hypothetical protein